MLQIGCIGGTDAGLLHLTIFAEVYLLCKLTEQYFPMVKSLFAVLAIAFLLSSCGAGGGGNATGPHATVRMREGSSVSGVVTQSSASEIQLKGDDQVARTIPMSQVRAVEYDEAMAATPAPAPA